MVTTQETTYALAKSLNLIYADLCGHYDPNEYLKLFILETQRGRTLEARSRIFVNNPDIFVYVNSKFV